MNTPVASRIGGTTSPSKLQLVNAARLILDNCGVSFSTNKVLRLVLRFRDRCPYADGYLFFNYLAAEVNLTHEQKQRALADPEIASVIGYADPTGETAVRRALRTSK